MQTHWHTTQIGVGDSIKSRSFTEKLLVFLVAFTSVVLIPVLHFYILRDVWAPPKPSVNRNTCKCGCFDTVFRGRYEWPPSGYKHVYFNVTTATLKIWSLLVLVIVALYECIRYMAPLIWHGTSRTPMVMLFITSLLPHYQGWWEMFGHINEDFYDGWKQQIFFSITEVFSTAAVLHLASTKNRIEPWKLLIILNVNVTHVIVRALGWSGHNVRSYEILRDLTLLVPDVFHVLVSYFELSIMAQNKRISLRKLFYREEIMTSALLVALFVIFGNFARLR